MWGKRAEEKTRATSSPDGVEEKTGLKEFPKGGKGRRTTHNYPGVGSKFALSDDEKGGRTCEEGKS